MQGLIRNNQARVEALDRLSRSDARAVIVHLDSPGGTTAGSEQLYDSLRALQAKKPMVVVVDGLAASGAYIAALSCDHIVAQDTSLVGSIGVLFQYPNFTDVLKTIGIKVEEVKSSPLKAAPNGFEPTSPEARAAIEAIVRELLCLVQGPGEEPPPDERQRSLPAVADGRVFTGRQGVAAQAGRRDRQRTDRAGLAGEGKEGAGRARRCAIIAGAAIRRAFLPACGGLDLPGRWAFPRLRSASRSGAACRRSKDSTLTVSWRFGTLRSVQLSSEGGASMIKSELVQRIAAQNPHLYQRDVENIVNAILGEITNAMAQGDRVELRGFGAFSVKHRPARTGRNPRTGAHVSVDRSRCRSSRPARKCASG